MATKSKAQEKAPEDFDSEATLRKLIELFLRFRPATAETLTIATCFPEARVQLALERLAKREKIVVRPSIVEGRRVDVFELVSAEGAAEGVAA